MKPVREQTPAELAFNLQDLNEVIAIQEGDARRRMLPPEQVQNVYPKLGQYQDERHDVLGEMRRRVEPPPARRSRRGGADEAEQLAAALSAHEARPSPAPLSTAEVDHLVGLLRGA